MTKPKTFIEAMARSVAIARMGAFPWRVGSISPIHLVSIVIGFSARLKVRSGETRCERRGFVDYQLELPILKLPGYCVFHRPNT